MIYQVFYTSHSKGQSISSSEPQTMDRDRICVLLPELLQTEDDFLGIMDQEGIVLQFMRLDAGGFLVEVPNPEARFSLQRRCTPDKLFDLLAHLPTNLTNLDLSEFESVEWPAR